MTISKRDQAAIWHPFTQHQTTGYPMPIARGEGAYLVAQDGKRYLDLISSWWVNILGHARKEIAEAIYQQALTLEHVIFAGFTHEPAVQLAETLLQLLGGHFSKVFYSDNGSTAIEIALKMAYQYWYNQGEKQRKRFIAFECAYHGDTFGAMAVGKSSGFYTPFEDLLFTVDSFAYPATWLNDPEIEQKEKIILEKLSQHLEKYGKETAAMIIEPLVQGAGGMRMCRPEFLQKLQAVLAPYGVLTIYDEVMTGFHRTGTLFACHKAKTNPDIICLAKGLTGGFLPLAATICQEKIYQAFLGATFAKALAHGHSFTANPLGCAAALASLQLLQSSEIKAQIAKIEAIHSHMLPKLHTHIPVQHMRYCGTIAAFDLQSNSAYGSQLSQELRGRFLEKGLLVRPLGNVIYFMPPYCVKEQELQQAYHLVIEAIQGVTA